MHATIADIVQALGAEALGAPALSAEITGITWDSRQVRAGDLYVCLPGERVDGHDFAPDAVRAGAAAVLATRPLCVDVQVPILLVDDASAAFTRLAAWWRTQLTGTVVGLTGSSGKTTTKNLVRDVLSAAGSVVATRANQNNELGVPNTLLAADADTRSVVVEMGMRGTGQIAELCAIAHPDWGLVTNVGESHIELLGSREAIAHAKAELLEALPDGRGIAFVNASDDYAAELCSHARLAQRGVRIVFFEGGDAHAHADELGIAEDTPFVWASDIKLDAWGLVSFTMHARGFAALDLPEADGTCACALQLGGLHNVSNACSAAAVGLASGMTLALCCDALGASQPEQGRQRLLEGAGGITVIDDAYNANPDSMGASLAMFAAMDVKGRRIAVLGDMLELGDFSQDAHERMGALAGRSNVDALVCVGELSRFMAAAAVRVGMPPAAVLTVDDAVQAAEAVRSLLGEGAGEGDAVLVKASHSIGLESVVEGLVG